MLSNVYAECPARDCITLLPSAYIYPLSKQQGDVFRETGRSPVPLDAAYGIHLHLGTWWRADPLRRRRIRALRRMARWPRRLIRALSLGVA
jgi:hypothetical protein